MQEPTPVALAADRARTAGATTAIVTALSPGRGPRIIAVPRAPQPVAPQAHATEPPTGSANATVPPQTVRAAQAPAAQASVRVGRLPPREAGERGGTEPAAARPDDLPPVPVVPTLPRRPFLKAGVRDLEAAAARVGLGLDPDSRRLAQAVLESGSALSTAPRGSGHSLVALVAGLLLPQCVLVVGPDAQPLSGYREKLERASVRAVVLDDTKPGEPSAAVLDGIASGATKVVLATPRWLAHDGVARALGSAGVALVAVLDAQRASVAHPGFLPAHARLAPYLRRLGRPPVLALAPGAGSAVRDDLTEALFARPPEVVEGRAIRPHVTLELATERGVARRAAVIDAVRRLPKPMVVLASSTRDVDALHGSLVSLGLPAHRYHEELRTGARAGEQLLFSMPGDKTILVATSAFAPSPSGSDEDPEGVPFRYGRWTTKSDVRSLVRLDAPPSLEQLVDELSLLGRDGQPGEALVFHDPTDRAAIESAVQASRPSGEHLLLLGRALEATTEPTLTTEALALAARVSLRVVEMLALHLDGMGLVTCKGGWLRRVAPERVLLREIRGLAERYATVRSLDVRRAAEVESLASPGGCRRARLERLLGSPTPAACGRCSTCSGAGFADAPAVTGQRHPPARRFTVTAGNAPAESAQGTFHSDRTAAGVLTAKLADFR